MNHAREFLVVGALSGMFVGAMWGIVQWLLVAVFIMPRLVPSLLYKSSNPFLAGTFYSAAWLVLALAYAGVGCVLGLLFVLAREKLPSRLTPLKALTFYSIVWLLIEIVGYAIGRSFTLTIVPSIRTEILPPILAQGLDVLLFLGGGLFFGIIFNASAKRNFASVRVLAAASVSMRELTSRMKMVVIVAAATLAATVLVSVLSYGLDFLPVYRTIEERRELASLVMLVPLYVWYTSTRGSRTLWETRHESKKRSLIPPIILLASGFLLPFKLSIIVAVVLTIVLVEGYTPSSFGFSFRKFLSGLALGGLLLLAMLLPIVIGLAVRYGPAFVSVLSSLGFDLQSLPLTLLYAVLIIGVAEEGLFRGYVQTKFGKVLGMWRAVLLQAVIFAVLHFDRRFGLEDQVFRLLQVFLFGVLVGVYFWNTGSLVGVVFVHGLWDTFVLNVRGLPAILVNVPISAILKEIASGKVLILLGNLLNQLAFQVGIAYVLITAVMCVYSRRICAFLGQTVTEKAESQVRREDTCQ